jgi:hypothetical protein
VMGRIGVQLAFDCDDGVAVRGADVEAHVGGWFRTPRLPGATAAALGDAGKML